MRRGFAFLIVMFFVPTAAAGTNDDVADQKDVLIADVNRELIPVNERLDPFLVETELIIQSNFCFTYDRYDMPDSVRAEFSPACGALSHVTVSIAPRPGGGYDITVCVQERPECITQYVPDHARDVVGKVTGTVFKIDE